MNNLILKRIFGDLLIACFGLIMSLLAKYSVHIGMFTASQANNFGHFCIFVFTLFAIFYFFHYSLEFINRTIKKETFTYGKYLYANVYILILIQTTFALNYMSLSMFENESFKGVVQTTDCLQKFGEFFYFSAITFATIGYGDIVPNSLTAKMLVTIETITSVVFIVFIISNYSNIRASFSSGDPGIGHIEDIDKKGEKDKKV